MRPSGLVPCQNTKDRQPGVFAFFVWTKVLRIVPLSSGTYSLIVSDWKSDSQQFWSTPTRTLKKKNQKFKEHPLPAGHWQWQVTKATNLSSSPLVLVEWKVGVHSVQLLWLKTDRESSREKRYELLLHFDLKITKPNKVHSLESKCISSRNESKSVLFKTFFAFLATFWWY